MESLSAPRNRESCSTGSIFMVCIGCMYISACKERNIINRKNLSTLIRNSDWTNPLVLPALLCCRGAAAAGTCAHRYIGKVCCLLLVQAWSRLYQAAPLGAAQRTRGIAQAVTTRNGNLQNSFSVWLCLCLVSYPFRPLSPASSGSQSQAGSRLLMWKG